MPKLATKISCPNCGTRQPADNERCRICTRPLGRAEGVSEQVYREALWSQSIDDKRRRTQRISPWAVLVVAVVGLVAANWFHFRVGPEWAHSPKPWVNGSDWKTYRGVPGVRVDLPGNPERRQVTTSTGTLESASVWINSQWVATRDADTRAAGVVESARSTLRAILVVGGGAAPADPRSAAADAVSALLGASLTNPITTDVQRPEGDQELSFVARFEGAPDDRGEGTVRARVLVSTDDTGAAVWHLAVTAVMHGDDAELHDVFAADLVPEG